MSQADEKRGSPKGSRGSSKNKGKPKKENKPDKSSAEKKDKSSKSKRRTRSKEKRCSNNVSKDLDTSGKSLSASSTTSPSIQVNGNREQEAVDGCRDSVEDIFQTPNEYNKSIGFNISDPQTQQQQSVSDTGESVQNTEEDRNSDLQDNTEAQKGVEEKPEQLGAGGEKCKGISKDCETTKDNKKVTKKKITRKKIKRQTGPLTIAAKKPKCAAGRASTVSDCNNTSQELDAVTPVFGFKKVPMYIAPTPSPASSFSSAGMTPKHVRMLDFGLVHTPPGLPGQSPPISSIGAQVTLGFRSPMYVSHGTPGSIHSQGGNTPNGSDCGYLSPAADQAPVASSEPPAPNASSNSAQDFVPPCLVDHAFGQLTTTDTQDAADVSQTQTAGSDIQGQGHDTLPKPSFIPEESSDATRFAESLSKVESPNLIRALARTIGIPTEDSNMSMPDISGTSTANTSVSDQPGSPEMSNLHICQSETQEQLQNIDNPQLLPNKGNPVEAEVAVTLLEMANTPVKGELGQAEATESTSNQCQENSAALEQQTTLDGAQNEDSSSSSVSSSVLMPPPTMTPKRHIYKTPKKQMIRTSELVSPAKSPGLKCLIEASLMSELSQSPRTSKINLDLMDEFLNSTILGSPVFKTKFATENDNLWLKLFG